MSVRISSFSHSSLLAHPTLLTSMAELYCYVFRHDPNFAEYMQCPSCKKYFSEEVVVAGLQYCPSCSSHPKLVVAWEADSVKCDILSQSNSPWFAGAQISDGKVCSGFAWLWGMPFSQVRKEWGNQIANMIAPHVSTQQRTVYLDETAVHPDLRGQGFGKELVRRICAEAKRDHPNEVAILRTHARSHARKIFESVGFRFLCDDSEFGSGRIMMMLNRCSDFKVYK